MLAHYINLKTATARRVALEAQLLALPTGQWTAQRFEAIVAESELCRRTPGRISIREKACFLSHRGLLTQELKKAAPDPFMVWEDDVLLGESAHWTVDRFLHQADSSAWDILYTDFIVPDLGSMLELLARRRRLHLRKEVEILDLKGRPFAGASAYVVNPKSLQRIVSLLNSVPVLDEPIDLLLRRLIHQGDLQGYALFPFVTTVADTSLQSQIQIDAASGTDLAWTLFRRLMWTDCQVESLYPMCNQLSSLHPDPESSIMGVITCALISPFFKAK